MICYHCKKARDCSVFRALYTMSNDFCINDCRDYEEVFGYTYKKIADNDDLMHLIYDYFTDNIEGKYSDEAVRNAITTAMWDL